MVTSDTVKVIIHKYKFSSILPKEEEMYTNNFEHNWKYDKNTGNLHIYTYGDIEIIEEDVSNT